MGTAVAKQQSREVHFHHTVNKEQGQYIYTHNTHVQMPQILVIII